MNFTEHPKSASVDRGGEVNLSCTYPLEITSVNISWTGPIGANCALSTSLDNSTKSTLLITAINGSYAGDYSCTAQFADVWVDSATATLTINRKYIYYCTYITNYTHEYINCMQMSQLSSQWLPTLSR